jgi:SRSO17 transposase
VIVAVYTTYATEHGHALIDRDLYVQRDWFADPARMAAAGFPADHAFATKPALALAQAKRALAAGISPAWATGDEVYGRSAALREFCEAAGIGYVFAVPVDHQLTTSGRVRMRADQALALVEPEGWNRRSRGAGAKGRRYYDWAWIATDHPRRWLLIRRTISDPSELAYFCAYAPEHRACSLTDLVEIAGMRWKVEDDFQDSNPPSDSTRPRSGTTGPGNATPPWRWLPSRSSPCSRPSSGPRTPPRSCPITAISSRRPTAASSR